jgi:hypothetical protein
MTDPTSLPATPDPDDEILSARLGVLQRNLERTVRACDYRTAELRPKTFPVEANAWNSAFMGVREKANGALDRIDMLRDDLHDGQATRQEAWDSYARLRVDAQDVCRDCVELIGGFALREHLRPLEEDDQEAEFFLDRRICTYAESVVEHCARAYPKFNILAAIPAAHDTVAKALGRIVRVRFPEWTIWSLPLAAFEYGLVVFSEGDFPAAALDDECKKREKALPEEDPGTREQVTRLLFADAFATYLLGPAYASAAIVLRFDPRGPHGGELGVDVERAEAMFAMLDLLYPDGIGDSARRFVAEHLRARWDETLRGMGRGPDATTRDRATAFAVRAHRRFGRVFYENIPYRPEPTTEEQVDDSWSTSEKLFRHWRSQLPDALRQAYPAPRSYSLRDVLNAAWRGRLEKPDATSAFADKVRASWNVLLEEQTTSTGASFLSPKEQAARSGGVPKRPLAAVEGRP